MLQIWVKNVSCNQGHIHFSQRVNPAFFSKLAAHSPNRIELNVLPASIPAIGMSYFLKAARFINMSLQEDPDH